MVPSRLRTVNEEVDQWFRDHVVVWWLVLAAIPGGTYAAAQVLLSDEPAFQAVLLGAVFGAGFATVTVVVQRRRG